MRAPQTRRVELRVCVPRARRDRNASATAGARRSPHRPSLSGSRVTGCLGGVLLVGCRVIVAQTRVIMKYKHNGGTLALRATNDDVVRRPNSARECTGTFAGGRDAAVVPPPTTRMARASAGCVGRPRCSATHHSEASLSLLSHAFTRASHRALRYWIVSRARRDAAGAARRGGDGARGRLARSLVRGSACCLRPTKRRTSASSTS